jgi:transcriptional regulator with XRE-family HTH domain
LSGVLRKIREEQGRTLKQVARLGRLSYPNISAIERGEQSPNLRTIRVLAEIYGYPASVLVGMMDHDELQSFQDDARRRVRERAAELVKT